MERTEPRNRIRQRRPPTAGARLAVVPKKLSRLHRPEGMSLEAWQTTLRRQFGREQRFLLKNSGDRKSTRLNSSHLVISYAVFCLKKKKISVRVRSAYQAS